jgi:hypothetical protein
MNIPLIRVRQKLFPSSSRPIIPSLIFVGRYFYDVVELSPFGLPILWGTTSTRNNQGRPPSLTPLITMEIFEEASHYPVSL